jgi:hypothetical protein
MTETDFHDQTSFFIDSDMGRIGPFWWFNSDNVEVFPEDGSWITWGTCGFGRRVHIYVEFLDD